ncbi:hybrid sensor histidine kinase/response regulator [Bacteroides stercoris]|jgi:two-component system sensor histidine kinase EvgS|uniref:histidine kinase n=1 Tax=Bacteroides stercoris TaxID=46506 RepID=A0A3E4UJH0_BACSE|nr:hybrid sensor histidine kinase/response regulator [Bacteroides stercoris]RGM09784.1 hybrid sensor histidine kinase/response regulator [Bacteroides stercoris]
MKLLLQHKILFGYLILITVLGGAVAILIHERNQYKEIEAETLKIRSVRFGINKAHRRITGLAIRGESVVAWEEVDYRDYRHHRLLTDSLLQTLKPQCWEYVHPGQIDTLRHLLAKKETHLRYIMQSLDRRDERDSLLVTQLPEVARRATRVRTIRQKKKGIAGLFGKKEEIRVMPSAGELHALSDSLTAMQRKQEMEMDAYADSLRTRNRTLNIQLNCLINDLNEQAQTAFAARERKMTESQDNSIRLFTAAISLSIILLFLSYLAIHRELRRNAKEKRKREEIICKLKASNTQNEELIRIRRNLMQSVTHDLRSPLAVISGNAELLLNDTEEESRIRHAQTINVATGRMAGMINNLLEYFRLDSGKETPIVKPFKLYSIAETLETEFAPLAKGKQLIFIAENHTDEIVSGDKNLILSIGSNLLSNAIKFTRSGTIMLVTDYKDGTFTLSVSDTGTGMTEEQQTIIFTPFERLGNAVTEDGFGLGLAIVADTVKLLNGSITVESEPGKGSRFTISLPLPRAKDISVVKKTVIKYSILSRCSVLAIDNNGMLLDMMKEIYKQFGAECDICLTVGELTDRMRLKDYDLLITDLKMAEVNGYEVLELLRTSEIGNSQTIPVVAATAAGYVTEEELKERGFAAVLYKPYSIDELLAVTEKSIGQKHASRIDLSPLLVFGNKRRTLEKLATTTQADMNEVCKAAEAKDMKALDGWVHHLRSSWMLIKAEQPLAMLYEAVHKENISDKDIQSAVKAVLAQGRLIVDLARKEAKRWAE